MHILNDIYLTAAEIPARFALDDVEWIGRVGPIFDEEAIRSVEQGRRYVEAIRSEDGKQLWKVLEIQVRDASTSRTKNEILVARVARAE